MDFLSPFRRLDPTTSGCEYWNNDVTGNVRRGRVFEPPFGPERHNRSLFNSPPKTKLMTSRLLSSASSIESRGSDFRHDSLRDRDMTSFARLATRLETSSRVSPSLCLSQRLPSPFIYSSSRDHVTSFSMATMATEADFRSMYFLDRRPMTSSRVPEELRFDLGSSEWGSVTSVSDGKEELIRSFEGKSGTGVMIPSSERISHWHEIPPSNGFCSITTICKQRTAHTRTHTHTHHASCTHRPNRQDSGVV